MKKALALLLAVSVMLGTTGLASAAVDPGTSAVTVGSCRQGRSVPAASYAAVYSAFYAAAKAGQTTATATLPEAWAGTQQEWKELFGGVLTEITTQHPQLMVYSAGARMSGATVEISIQYFVENPAEISAQVTAKVNQIVSAQTASDDSDYQKALKLHDYLVNNVSYDEDAAADAESNLNAFIPYGALIEGKAVCDGYAKAYLLLCQKAGVEAIYAAGIAMDGSNEVAHAWNVLTLNGGSYLVDCTWDDPIGGTQVYYDYFLIGSDEADSVYLPEAAYSYNLSATKYDPSDNPGTDEPGTDEPGTDKPGTDEPGTDEPGTDKPGTDEPGTDKPGTDEPGTDEPGTDKPGTDEPGTDEPGTDKPGTDEPGTDKPGTDEPGTDKPGTDKPGTDKPVTPPVSDDDDEGEDSPFSGGGSGSSSSGRWTSSDTSNAVSSSPITSSEASSIASAAASQAVSQAAASGASSVEAAVSLTNVSVASPEVFKAIVSAANTVSAEKNVAVSPVIHADTKNGNAVEVRLYIDPVKAAGLTSGIRLSASIHETATAEYFGRYFSNQVKTLVFDHAGSFGMNVGVAARVDLTGMNVSQLRFYLYDSVNNTLTPLQNISYTVDGNGYLHLTTAYGGTLVISEGALTAK